MQFVHKCSYINTIHHSSCQACGRRKPRGKGTVGQAIGKDAAEKSKGLFEAEDWCCSKCGNINWARRATCNICNAKKFAEVEARTGYGGGYMDRQQVEYIPRNESEEEYDEVLNHIWFCQSEEAATEVRRGRGGEAVGLMIVLYHHQDLDQARIPRLLETVPRAAINRTVGLQVPIGAVQLVHDVRLRLLREAEVVAVLVTTADLENLIAVANLPPIQVRPVEIRTGTVDIDDSDDAENEI
ncbi:Zinc finger Ran-binding domain-containing protein 2 [Trichinella britovi]|uniref:Zinc finger Ran-binding domain-containing protein 2 n=1 Tax=Trichinella britovi TaxID=45882 RepID=A0A0V1CMT4_TRIBR|nr:Zinc finger Ran-binding domain-containing protein 2 [Trichinella britovi]